jgi:hypothetical protein
VHVDVILNMANARMVLLKPSKHNDDEAQIIHAPYEGFFFSQFCHVAEVAILSFIRGFSHILASY